MIEVSKLTILARLLLAKIIIEQVPNCVVYKFYSDHVGFSNDSVAKKI